MALAKFQTHQDLTNRTEIIEAKPVHTKKERPVLAAGRVLSISIPDASSVRALGGIQGEHEIFTGSGLGGFLALLLAAGVSVEKLQEALLENGKYITKRGVTRGAREYFHALSFGLIGTDPRNRFESVLQFSETLIGGIDNISLSRLPYDVFFPVVNATTHQQGEISKAATPDLPLSSAIKIVLASLLDFAPLVSQGDPKLEGALEYKGVIWNSLSIGQVSPDMMLLRKYGFSGLSFDSFIAPHKIQQRSSRTIKNHMKHEAIIHSLEIGYHIQQSLSVDYMRQVLGSDYRVYVLPSEPFNNELTEKQIKAHINHKPLLAEI